AGEAGCGAGARALAAVQAAAAIGHGGLAAGAGGTGLGAAARGGEGIARGGGVAELAPPSHGRVLREARPLRGGVGRGAVVHRVEPGGCVAVGVAVAVAAAQGLELLERLGGGAGAALRAAAVRVVTRAVPIGAIWQAGAVADEACGDFRGG